MDITDQLDNTKKRATVYEKEAVYKKAFADYWAARDAAAAAPSASPASTKKRPADNDASSPLGKVDQNTAAAKRGRRGD